MGACPADSTAAAEIRRLPRGSLAQRQSKGLQSERQTGNGWYVGSYMLGHPESLRYQSVTILRIGLSAGNPFGATPQRPYAARPNERVEGEEMVQTATSPRGGPVRAGAAG